MSKLKFAIPIAIVFTSPWVHRLAFENLMLANPAIPPEAAHIVAFCGVLFAGLVSLNMVFG